MTMITKKDDKGDEDKCDEDGVLKHILMNMMNVIYFKKSISAILALYFSSTQEMGRREDKSRYSMISVT